MLQKNTKKKTKEIEGSRPNTVEVDLFDPDGKNDKISGQSN